MRKLMAFGAVAALVTLAACDSAGDNQVEVERPATVTDTVTLPTINMPDSVVLPTVDVDVKTGRDTVPVRRDP